MLDSGHIRLHRSLLSWEWYGDINTTRLFIHLLLLANWKQEKWRGLVIERGQRVTSRDKLAEETGLTVQQVRTSLNKLKSTGEITSKTTNKYSVITIVNYDKYQFDNQQTNQPVTNNQPANNQQITTNEESNKAIKQEKGIPPLPPKPEPAPPDKVKYADYVRMAEAEYDKLVEKVGAAGATRCVEILDNYKGSSGKTYKSDYRAILNWVIERYEEEQQKAQPKSDLNGWLEA